MTALLMDLESFMVCDYQISLLNVIGESPKKKPKERHARTTVLPSRKRKSGENEDTTRNGIILLFSANMN